MLACLDAPRPEWLYGLEIAERTGLKSGSLYPILIRLAERGLLEAEWQEPAREGRPPRHAYRILPAGRKALAEAAAEPAKGTLQELRS
ncbi:PadR family transcriptional regulator [Croceibacterium aestuarii]|uniref:PadR family transcriptional regulator n=1 Tax=Croceibacterium aestuarii TaxID=3064139 RepID=UPI00272E6B24|nr:helix-turn-helix transcriptional regulator [Croceibacterium sp. D39]